LEQIIKQRVIKDWQMEKAIKKRLGMHASFHAKQKGKKKSFQEACELVPHLGLVVG
jgi:hypothetical protein